MMFYREIAKKGFSKKTQEDRTDRSDQAQGSARQAY